jgi:hypothetical protein
MMTDGLAELLKNELNKTTNVVQYKRVTVDACVLQKSGWDEGKEKDLW